MQGSVGKWDAPTSARRQEATEATWNSRQECRGNNYLPSQDIQAIVRRLWSQGAGRGGMSRRSRGTNVRGWRSVPETEVGKNKDGSETRPPSKTETLSEQRPKRVGETGSGGGNVSYQKGEGEKGDGSREADVR